MMKIGVQSKHAYVQIINYSRSVCYKLLPPDKTINSNFYYLLLKILEQKKIEDAPANGISTCRWKRQEWSRLGCRKLRSSYRIEPWSSALESKLIMYCGCASCARPRTVNALCVDF
ncbi:hypothetical protein EVAR_14915_1 [Eumeta japonica]|uniref:Uncharacterized protein n=1 Tax=Eumeta variegata TaxID=151549 RepID=A0A4C1XQ28_EUMVA|nr:hypothetical protein EVAR_14915_1 [Eumeta japonica]